MAEPDGTAPGTAAHLAVRQAARACGPVNTYLAAISGSPAALAGSLRLCGEAAVPGLAGRVVPPLPFGILPYCC
jgi:hypothetical protein